MKNPKIFGGSCGILNQVMVILTVAYIIIGFFGYVKYGDMTEGSITLNLPDKDGCVCFARIMLIRRPRLHRFLFLASLRASG